MDTRDSFQVTFLLRGDDARRFREYKRNQSLLKDAEAARKLVLERLAEVETDTELFQRKPMVRADVKKIVLETLRDALEGTG